APSKVHEPQSLEGDHPLEPTKGLPARQTGGARVSGSPGLDAARGFWRYAARRHARTRRRAPALGADGRVSAYAGIVLRVGVGAIYLFQAYLALFVMPPKGLATYIEKLGFHVHTILAVAVIAINGIGGAMLVIGLWTRLTASLNAAVLLLGLLTVYV